MKNGSKVYLLSSFMKTLYNERCKTGYVILFDESQCGIGYNVVQFILDAIAVLTFFLCQRTLKKMISAI